MNLVGEVRAKVGEKKKVKLLGNSLFQTESLKRGRERKNSGGVEFLIVNDDESFFSFNRRCPGLQVTTEPFRSCFGTIQRGY